MVKRELLNYGINLCNDLGYSKYAAQGGDWGAVVSARLGSLFPERVIGVHFNLAFISPPDNIPQTDEEKIFVKKSEEWMNNEGGYSHVHGTKPQTLGYGLSDSPVGLAAWILEKWETWSDHGEKKSIEDVFSKDEILTNICIYWFTNTINSSLYYYLEVRSNPRLNRGVGEFVSVPCGFALFPKEIRGVPPKSWVSRGCNLVHWSVFDKGGHFAAMEQPKELVEDIRAFFRKLRPPTRAKL